ncbi:glycosyltransferase family 2 protein [Hanstruepera ponticola]|uniref:glycosyltransferase family 2 protein n=1 Tax=Hanstruepera ponticola TaxID=2042995 RepID=UPI000CF193AC|nr:glycosyltransferase family 2 protein [Hanstruepera ponticola]
MYSSYPKISLVTPVYNQVDYIEATIQSVITQDYPNLEYIIIDGGSTDGTLEIIKAYEEHLSTYVSERDEGMYDALNKGFEHATGDIMGWINSDDILLPKALLTLSKLFTDLPQVNWLQGLNTVIDLKGYIISTQFPKRFSLITVLNGDYRWIQQESTFWRRSLWETSGAKINTNLKLAGDFELWFRFFQHARLYYVAIPLGAFRKRPGQLSALHYDTYNEEVFDIVVSYSQNQAEKLALKKIRWISFFIRLLSKLRLFNLNYLESKRYKLLNIEGLDIRYLHDKQQYSLRDNRLLQKERTEQ